MRTHAATHMPRPVQHVQRLAHQQNPHTSSLGRNTVPTKDALPRGPSDMLRRVARALIVAKPAVGGANATASAMLSVRLLGSWYFLPPSSCSGLSGSESTALSCNKRRVDPWPLARAGVAVATAKRAASTSSNAHGLMMPMVAVNTRGDNLQL
jgi:hypothetical protein